ncbi:MAG: LysE family translocator [Hyphomicrobiales bacterium]|nr:LysE family translocator [Hyphomicrobiales bacterium]
MSLDLLLAFSLYAFVSSITPGPNNTMLLASGVNHGLVRTVPHLVGVNLGFAFLMTMVGLGLGGLFRAVPIAHDVLRWAGAAYLLRLAWLIARSGDPDAEGKARPPMTFLEAAAFQWLNPKAWVMAVGALATYGSGDGLGWEIALLVAIFTAVNAPCILVWAAAGSSLRGFLADPRRLAVFNWTMAALLVASLRPLLASTTG